MKIAFISLTLLMVICSCEPDKPATYNFNDLSTTSSQVNEEDEEPQSTQKSKEDIDSGHYHIVREYYESGVLYTELYENKLTKLDDCKEYYENGQLKATGTMIYNSPDSIGIWNFYSPEGVVENTINYDKKHKISYFKALKIAEKKGYKMPNIEVSLTSFEGEDKTCWVIVEWSKKKSGNKAEGLFIDAKTGKVEEIYSP